MLLLLCSRGAGIGVERRTINAQHAIAVAQRAVGRAVVPAVVRDARHALGAEQRAALKAKTRPVHKSFVANNRELIPVYKQVLGKLGG